MVFLPPRWIASSPTLLLQNALMKYTETKELVRLPPPFYDGFTARHRINAGIVGQQDAGLTTGHGSYLPDAWGRDEYLGGQESSLSGPNNNAYSKINTPDIQVVASYDLPPVAPSFRNQRFTNPAATTGSAPGGSVRRQAYSTFGSASASQDSGF